MRLHQLHHTRRLKRLSALRPRREGAAEEYKVRDIDVELACEVAEVLPILPHCVGTEAVDEKQRGLGLFMGFRHPTMHDCAVAKIGGDGAEAGIGKGVTVEPIFRCGEAEPFGQLERRHRKVVLFPKIKDCPSIIGK